MNIEIIWLDGEDTILNSQQFDPNSNEWSAFEQKTLYDIIHMGGEECTHIQMTLVN